MTRSSPATWDVVVVGAGPAGTSAALGAMHADPSLRVLLLDRDEFPRDKPCGDGVAPQVVDALAEVGADDVVSGWTPLRRLALARQASSVDRPLARPVWVVPRRVFDARLTEHAQRAGARLQQHRVKHVEIQDGEVCLDGRVRARVVVGADGAHSLLRRFLGLPVPRRQALAIRGYVPTPVARRGIQHIVYGERRQPAYAWSFDRGDGLSNVGYGELLGGAPDPPSRRLLLDQLELLLPGATVGGEQWRAHHLPLSGPRWHQPAGPVLLAGDAAGLVNPMTGEGIYYAVATGMLAGRSAARALAAGDATASGADYRREVQRLLARHLRHTTVASRLSGSPRMVEAGIRGAARDQQVFDDLVEIGLGSGLITPRVLGGLAGGLLRTAAENLSSQREGRN